MKRHPFLLGAALLLLSWQAEAVAAEPARLDYWRAAGSAGARLLLRHVLRPSLGVSIALLGLDLPVLVSGAVVIEVIFAWPGVGRVAAESVLGADYPLALASAMLTASMVIVGRLLSEAIADRVNPRRLEPADGVRP